jgi:hypothetical protein
MSTKSNVVPIHKDWVAIWKGQIDGAEYWFVEAHIGGESLIGSHYSTQHGARVEASVWGLPVVIVP